MKYSLLLALTAIACMLTYARADCEDGHAAKDPEDSEVKSWFKNLGCTIKKGAEDLGESAKPWAEKIGATAKEFGNTVVQKYDEIKHKLSDDNGNAAASGDYTVIESAPTEKVPLAPLFGDEASQAAAGGGAAAAAPGEDTAKLKPIVTPDSFDQRFLFQLSECPKGQTLDHKNRCRPV